MARLDEGTTSNLHTRATPEEAQMLGDIAKRLGLSANKGARWAIRFAYEHAVSTTDHTNCAGTSPCANATQGIRPGTPRTPR